jgi:hypothetical protein
MNKQFSIKVHKKRFIDYGFIIIGIFASSQVLGNPNPLSGLAGLFYLGVGVLAIIAIIMLLPALKVKNIYAKFFLSLPAVIWVVFSLPLLFEWDYSGITFFLISVSLLFSILLILVYFPVFKLGHKKPTIIVLVLCFALALLLNPAYFNVIGTEPVDNDPFNGKFNEVLDVLDAGFIYTDENKQYRVDNYLVLKNGRKIPGIFHGFKVGDRVLIENLKGSPYAYQVYGEKKQRYQKTKPIINFPKKHLIIMKVPQNIITKPKGWGHNFK